MVIGMPDTEFESIDTSITRDKGALRKFGKGTLDRQSHSKGNLQTRSADAITTALFRAVAIASSAHGQVSEPLQTLSPAFTPPVTVPTVLSVITFSR
jgi:hypothetical protein